jgi:hypothetical protein
MKQNGKSASKMNPKGVSNPTKPVARRQRSVGLYPDKNLAKFLDKCRKNSKRMGY